MTLLQALVLGIVQGLTEFIPVSSDGHLNLVPFILGWDEPTLAFVVAAHIGTLAAVTWSFRSEVAALIRSALSWQKAPDSDKRLITFLVIATLPAVIVGLTLERLVERATERPVLVSLFLGLMGYILTSTENWAQEHDAAPRREIDELRAADALVMGLAQGPAILPGISRSGTTMAAGVRLGLSRLAAARFSFLMSIPIIFGAILAQLPDMLDEGIAGANAPVFATAIAASAVSGFFAVRWFLGVITNRGLKPFGIYLMFAMLAGLITALARG